MTWGPHVIWVQCVRTGPVSIWLVTHPLFFGQLLCPVQHLNWISIQIDIGQGLTVVHAHNTLYLDDQIKCVHLQRFKKSDRQLHIDLIGCPLDYQHLMWTPCRCCFFKVLSHGPSNLRGLQQEKLWYQIVNLLLIHTIGLQFKQLAPVVRVLPEILLALLEHILTDIFSSWSLLCIFSGQYLV